MHICIYDTIDIQVFFYKEACPTPALEKSCNSLIFGGFPYMPRVTYTVVHAECDVQVENSQFKQPGPNIWKNLILKNIIFYILVVNKNLYMYTYVYTHVL